MTLRARLNARSLSHSRRAEKLEKYSLIRELHALELDFTIEGSIEELSSFRGVPRIGFPSLFAGTMEEEDLAFFLVDICVKSPTGWLALDVVDPRLLVICGLVCDRARRWRKATKPQELDNPESLVRTITGASEEHVAERTPLALSFPEYRFIAGPVIHEATLSMRTCMQTIYHL
jgi:hypothetical protein